MTANTTKTFDTADRLDYGLNLIRQRMIEEFEKEMVERRQAEARRSSPPCEDHQADSRGTEL